MRTLHYLLRSGCQLVSNTARYLNPNHIYLMLVSLCVTTASAEKTAVVICDESQDFCSRTVFSNFETNIVDNYQNNLVAAGARLLAANITFLQSILFPHWYGGHTILGHRVYTDFSIRNHTDFRNLTLYQKNIVFLSQAQADERAYLHFQLDKLMLSVGVGVLSPILLWGFYHILRCGLIKPRRQSDVFDTTAAQPRKYSTSTNMWTMTTLTYFVYLSIMLYFVVVPAETLTIAGVAMASSGPVLFVPAMINICYQHGVSWDCLKRPFLALIDYLKNTRCTPRALPDSRTPLLSDYANPDTDTAPPPSPLSLRSIKVHADSKHDGSSSARSSVASPRSSMGSPSPYKREPSVCEKLMNCFRR